MFALCKIEWIIVDADKRTNFKFLSHFDVEKARPGDVGDWRPDLLACMDHIYAEGINSIASNIIAVDPWNQDFSFVIVDKQSSNHDLPFEFPEKIRNKLKENNSLRICGLRIIEFQGTGEL